MVPASVQIVPLQRSRLAATQTREGERRPDWIARNVRHTRLYYGDQDHGTDHAPRVSVKINVYLPVLV